MFTLAVPTEKEGATTTTVELTPPQASRSTRSSPRPAGSAPSSRPGSGENATITKVTWSGGAVPTGEDAASRSSRRRRARGSYTFGVRQTYSDGTVVDWSGPESSDTPAPVVEAVSSLGGGGSSTLAIVALALGGARPRARGRRGSCAARGGGRSHDRAGCSACRSSRSAPAIAAVVVIALLLSSDAEALSDEGSDSCDAAGRTAPTSSTSSSPSRRREPPRIAARRHAVRVQTHASAEAEQPLRRQRPAPDREEAAERRRAVEADDAGRVGRPEPRAAARSRDAAELEPRAAHADRGGDDARRDRPRTARRARAALRVERRGDARAVHARRRVVARPDADRRRHERRRQAAAQASPPRYPARRRRRARCSPAAAAARGTQAGRSRSSRRRRTSLELTPTTVRPPASPPALARGSSSPTGRR